MKVLLASQSSRRRKLIKEVVDNVTFTESGADEKLPRVNLSPSESAMFLAEKKAITSLRAHEDSLEDDELVIGCDTVVTDGNEIFGKPEDGMDAFNTLKKLSGKTHQVITAVCILNKDLKHDLFYETTNVTFNELTDDMIWDYIKTGDPFDKAGSYGIQNIPESYIKSVEGDINNVIGLPTEKLSSHLNNFDSFSHFEKFNKDKSLLEDVLKHHIKHIKPADKKMRKKAEEFLKTKTMPTWALGKLLDLAVDLVGMTGELKPDTSKKVIFVMAGDNGVAEEGVSAYPQEVTIQMAENISNGGAGINVLGNQVGAEVHLVDMGMKNIPEELNNSENVSVSTIHIGNGTKDIKVGPAMTRKEAINAIIAAYNLATEHIDRNGDKIIGIGELGIGNTTPATAIISTLGNLPVNIVTGRGTGLNDEQLEHKIEVISEAIKVNNPDNEDPIDVLAKLGGFEIAGMVGIILAACSRQIPVVIDGYVTASAALIAYHLDPKTGDYMIASHKSVEPGHNYFYNLINKEPLLDLNLRLGEGTGGALAMFLIDCASAILRDMASFDEAHVSNKD